MRNDFDRLADLELARQAAESAAAEALRYFGQETPVAYKSPDQPVTEADLSANRVLHELLIGRRPGYGWLSEETADSVDRLRRGRVWIVDPIDGTRSFVDGRPEYVVSVALAVEGEVELGVVLNPSTGERYHAVCGGGAFLDDRPLRIAPTPEEGGVLLASRSELRLGEFEPLRERWQILPLGSTAYKMVKVADGTGSAYLSRGPKSEWDVAAAALIVREACGTVTDLAGMDLRFNQPSPFVRGIVAAEATAHATLLRYVAALTPVERRWTGDIQ